MFHQSPWAHVSTTETPQWEANMLLLHFYGEGLATLLNCVWTIRILPVIIFHIYKHLILAESKILINEKNELRIKVARDLQLNTFTVWIVIITFKDVNFIDTIPQIINLFFRQAITNLCITHVTNIDKVHKIYMKVD